MSIQFVVTVNWCQSLTNLSLLHKQQVAPQLTADRWATDNSPCGAAKSRKVDVLIGEL
jgi:hypothetical protein